MPVLDTAVLFAAADPADKRHKDAVARLSSVGGRILVATASFLEFDLVLKSNGYTPSRRRDELKRMMDEFPKIDSAIRPVGPSTIYLAADIEAGYRLDYFDSLIAAEALAFDGELVSSERDFDVIPGLKRIPLEEGA